MTKQAMTQPVKRSLTWHLSYLREHLHGGTTEFKRRATVAMHFVQYPHLYAEGEVCRLYVEDNFFCLTLRDYLGTVMGLEHLAWLVAAMTPRSWDALLSLWDASQQGEVKQRCYEAALMYAWVPVGRLACGRRPVAPALSRIRKIDGTYFIAERWGVLGWRQEHRHLVLARAERLQRLMPRYSGGRTFKYGAWDLVAPSRGYRYDGILFEGPRFEGEHFEIYRYGETSCQWLTFGCENWLRGVFALEAEQ